jgi:hypothetical protein
VPCSTHLPQLDHHHHQITKLSHSINAIGPAPHRGGRKREHRSMPQLDDWKQICRKPWQQQGLLLRSHGVLVTVLAAEQFCLCAERGCKAFASSCLPHCCLCLCIRV